jgi:hypothetical protein
VPACATFEVGEAELFLAISRIFVLILLENSTTEVVLSDFRWWLTVLRYTTRVLQCGSTEIVELQLGNRVSVTDLAGFAPR